MPSGFGSRLVGVSVVAAALMLFIGAAGASAGTAPRTVALTISFTGSGELWVTGAFTSGRYTCTSTSSPCAATFHVPRRRRIVLHEQPANGWHLTSGWRAACYGSHSRVRSYPEQSCGLRLTARRTAQLTFVPPHPGEFLNPLPLGTTVSLGLYFSPFELTVNSTTLNATAEVEAVTDPNTGQPVNGPPPAGDQYTLVNLTLTNKGSTYTSNLPDFLKNVSAEGATSALYKPDTCVPPPLDLGSIGTVDTGQTETGNLCFTIASTDASVLLLRGWYEPPKPPVIFADYFALH
jgi:hypothetical protein